MIPYEELARALDAYRARKRGGAGAAAASVAYDQTAYEAPPAYDPPTAESQLPEYGSISTSGGGDDATHVGGMRPSYDDPSNEIDIGDVLSDEEEQQS
jgi:hypothetical protein